MAESSDKKIITRNKKAFHLYEILERIEAGIVLQGTEVKALREGKSNLKDAFAEFRRGEVFLLKAHIGQYSAGNIYNHDPERPRKLLMNKREIVKIFSKISERGYTFVPLALYFLRGKVKVEMGIAKGKREFDRKKSIEERERNRDLEREIRDREKG